MKIKRIRAKLVKKCSLCGKNFDRWDEEENFCFRHRFGYGSKYDCYRWISNYVANALIV